MYRFMVRTMVITSLVLLAAAGGLASEASAAKRQNQQRTVLHLIHAIGHSEGWGVEWRRGKPKLAKYNSATIAPFGLIYEFRGGYADSGARAWFKRSTGRNLSGTPAERALKYMALKLTYPSSAVYVRGLVRRDGTVNLRLLPNLQRKWAPVGASNDPRNLNSNWLTSVRKLYLSNQHGRILRSRAAARRLVASVYRGGPTHLGPPSGGGQRDGSSNSEQEAKIDLGNSGLNPDDILGLALLLTLLYLIVRPQPKKA